MIRINLFEKREKEPSKRPQVSLGGLPGLAAFLVVVIGLGFVVYKSQAYKAEIRSLNDNIAEANRTIQELDKALKTVDQYQVKKNSLEQKVELISSLKRMQRVPVHLLDQISRQLPDFLWLEGLDEKGGSIQIRGKATTYNAVSNFYNNLKDSPYFSDVTLGNTQRAQEGVSFLLSCRFNTPPEGTDEPAAASAAIAAPAPPRG